MESWGGLPVPSILSTSRPFWSLRDPEIWSSWYSVNHLLWAQGDSPATLGRKQPLDSELLTLHLTCVQLLPWVTGAGCLLAHFSCICSSVQWVCAVHPSTPRVLVWWGGKPGSHSSAERGNHKSLKTRHGNIPQALKKHTIFSFLLPSTNNFTYHLRSEKDDAVRHTEYESDEERQHRKSSHIGFILLINTCVFSHIWLFVTPWTVAHQAPLSMGFPRQEYWSGLPFPPPVDFPDPGIEPESSASPALARGFFTTEPRGKPNKG